MGSLRAAYYRLTDRLYWKAVRLLYPELLNSQYGYADELKRILGEGKVKRWIDLGCGHAFFSPFVAEKNEYRLDLEDVHVVGIDLDADSIGRHEGLNEKVVCDITERLPMGDGGVDLVTLNMVVEHVKDPVGLMREVERVLSEDGEVLIHTPNKWGYTTLGARLLPEVMIAWAAGVLLGRKGEDVYETHYLMNREKDLRKVAEAAGLELAKVEMVNSSGHLAVLPPLMLVELLWLRLIGKVEGLRGMRPCMIARLKKGQACTVKGKSERVAA
ncbi:hypothetical protein KS4_03950 [Poriferisphaera corsica]|uniref:Class I SAM-dependent methyltransferase n=1 Tax=Poriferisphaera corsica TaxID=2528020 RepID=A0A517YQ59_9BACT|nr:class I SAM-dependent methyltransferase [Poriferisphaera corsica]QDU32363.1 hypothetical protein KS4_03950 [Poriferisphaera corsica]